MNKPKVIESTPIELRIQWTSEENGSTHESSMFRIVYSTGH